MRERFDVIVKSKRLQGEKMEFNYSIDKLQLMINLLDWLYKMNDGK